MSNLCDNQVVDKLVLLFKDREDINELVQRAKGQLVLEAEKAKQQGLEKLFDSYIQILDERKSSEQIIKMVQDQKGTVVEKASKMTIGEENIPFLPVIKPLYLGYHGLMSMVQNDGKQGYCYLNPTLITDEFETPDELYYIYDVEDGQALLSKSPKKAIEIIKKQSRLDLTAAEDISLCIFTDVLSGHNVWATGSRYDGSLRVP